MYLRAVLVVALGFMVPSMIGKVGGRCACRELVWVVVVGRGVSDTVNFRRLADGVRDLFEGQFP